MKFKKLLSIVCASLLTFGAISSCGVTDVNSSSSTSSSSSSSSSSSKPSDSSSSSSDSTGGETEITVKATPEERRADFLAAAKNQLIYVKGTINAIETFTGGNTNVFVQDGAYGYTINSLHNFSTPVNVELGKTYTFIAFKGNYENVMAFQKDKEGQSITQSDETETYEATEYSELTTKESGIKYKVSDSTIKTVTENDDKLFITISYNSEDLTLNVRGDAFTSIKEKLTDVIAGDKLSVEGVFGSANNPYIFDAEKVTVTKSERTEYTSTAKALTTVNADETFEATASDKTFTIVKGEIKANEDNLYALNITLNKPEALENVDTTVITCATAQVKNIKLSGADITFDLTYGDANKPTVPGELKFSVKWAANATNTEEYTITLSEGVTHQELAPVESHVIDFVQISHDGEKTGGDEMSVESFNPIINSSNGLISSFSNLTKVYTGFTGKGIKLGSGNSLGSFSINLTKNVTKVIVNCWAYDSKKDSKLTVNSLQYNVTENRDTQLPQKVEVTLSEPTNQLIINTVKEDGLDPRIVFNSIELFF